MQNMASGMKMAQVGAETAGQVRTDKLAHQPQEGWPRSEICSHTLSTPGTSATGSTAIRALCTSFRAAASDLPKPRHLHPLAPNSLSATFPGRATPSSPC
jgi:hypothetical protein